MDGILEEKNVVRFQCSDDPLHAGPVPAEMTLDPDLHGCSHGLTDLLNGMQATGHILWGDILASAGMTIRVERPDLHSTDAIIQQLTGELTGIALPEGVIIELPVSGTGVIRRHGLPTSPAE